MALAETIHDVVAQSVRAGRNGALEAAIEICENAARDGLTAADCVAEIKSLKEAMNFDDAKQPAKVN